ncbi:MAG: response regulator [Verrucomicrobiia bacterium]
MNNSHVFVYSELLRDTLPDPRELSRLGPQTIPAGGTQVPATPKRSLHILCIDDDEQILEIMKDCLAHYEHRVKVASGGRRGVELFITAMLKSEPYDAVITDLGMPDMDGYQVARTIKTESPNTPIIMMTGGGTMMKEGGNMASAVDIVVGKPPCIQELNDLLLRMAKPA